MGSADVSNLVHIKSTGVENPAQRLETRAGQHKLRMVVHVYLLFQPGVPQNTEGFSWGLSLVFNLSQVK